MVTSLAVEGLVEVLEFLGAPRSLPSDEILLADIDELSRMRRPAARKLLMLAKRETVWRYAEITFGPDAEILHGGLGPKLRISDVRKVVNETTASIEATRKVFAGGDIPHSDCFGGNVVRQFERLRRTLWVAPTETASLQSGSVVYFIGADDRPDQVKIGVTANLRSRLRSLRTGMPGEIVVHLVIPGTPVDERALHARFASFRLKGEWFQLAGPISEFIESEKVKHSASVTA